MYCHGTTAEDFTYRSIGGSGCPAESGQTSHRKGHLQRRSSSAEGSRAVAKPLRHRVLVTVQCPRESRARQAGIEFPAFLLVRALDRRPTFKLNARPSRSARMARDLSTRPLVRAPSMGADPKMGLGRFPAGTGPGAPPIQVLDKSGTVTAGVTGPGTGELAPGPGRRRTNHWQGPSPGAAGRSPIAGACQCRLGAAALYH